MLKWRDSALEPPENPRRRQVEYGYDAADNVTLVKDDGIISVTYQYDEQNWLERAALANGVTVNYGWQPNGLVESVTYSNGMSRSFGYDLLDRMQTVMNAAGHRTTGGLAHTTILICSSLKQFDPASTESG